MLKSNSLSNSSLGTGGAINSLTASTGSDQKVGTSCREEKTLSYTSIPLFHWFFHENNTWHPYSDTVSGKIEELWIKQNKAGVTTIDDYTFDFSKSVSFKKGASKQKHLRRGTWFYLNKGIWTPYESPAALILETIWQKGEFTLPVLISNDPKRFVEFKNGSFYQYKPGKQNDSKAVRRGWNGTILETYTETTSIITTVTRDNKCTGPGQSPYTKVLQPGTPLPLNYASNNNPTVPQGYQQVPYTQFQPQLQPQLQPQYQPQFQGQGPYATPPGQTDALGPNSYQQHYLHC